MEVPFTRPFFRGDEGAAVADAIASGWVSQGPRVRAFEEAFAARVGAADAVATTNCTTALQLALYVSGVGPRRRGDRPVAVVHRHGERRLAERRYARVRGRRSAHGQHRRDDRRARHHRAHQGGHAGASARTAGRHGPADRARRATRAGRGRGRRVRDRRPLPVTADRLARAARLLLAAPAQGDHDRRGRHDRGRGSRGRRPAAQAAPARDGRLRRRPARSTRHRHRGLPGARLELRA